MIHLLRSAHETPIWSVRTAVAWFVLGLVAMFFGLSPSSARAGSVGFRAASCNQSSNSTTVTIPVPSGTVPGDLLVASVGIAKPSLANPSGWTQVTGLRGTVNSLQELVTWYRFATAPIPASYTFTGGASTEALAGGIVAFSGVSTTNPISGTPGQSIQSSITTSDTLPNSTGTYAGSMRYSAAGADDLTTSSYSGGMTMSCDEGNGTGVDISTSIAWQLTGAGATPDRTVSRTDNARSVQHTLVLNPNQCDAGGLNLAPPSAIAFTPTTLNGVDQNATATLHLTVDDQTASNAGWNVTATSTAFTNGSFSLPNTATSVISSTPTAGTDNCQMPTNSIGYPTTLPAGPVAPTAAKIFNAAAATGRGPVDIDLGLNLEVPASARVGSYASTWTLTLVSGP